MSSVAALSAPNQNTKPGSIIYSETIACKNSTVDAITTNNIDSKTNLNIGTSTALAINIGRSSITTNISGNLTSNAEPVPSWRASYYLNGAVINASTVESTIINTLSLVGSLVIPQVPIGFTLKTESIGIWSAGAATTFTIRYKINGVTALSTVIPAGVVVNQNFNIKHTLNVKNGGDAYVFCSVLKDGGAVLLGSNLLSAGWNLAGTNTVTMTGQYSDVNGSFVGYSFDAFSSQSS